MNPRLFTVTLAISALSLLIGCGLKSPEEAAGSPSAPPPPSASPLATPTATPRAAIEAKSSVEAGDPMVLVRGGRFVMGDPKEIDAPPHETAVSSFRIDKFLVTQGDYERLMGTNPSRWKSERNPVEQVRWSDAVRYCNKRSESEGLEPCYDLETWKCNFEAPGYRLPTEAEWEYACRAGTTTAYFFGDDPSKLGRFAWFEMNAGGHPRPVGQKEPNPWGLHDMSGNVWEWCNDFYSVDYYGKAPALDPRGPDGGDTRVVRGGAWRFSDESCRSGYRYNENPGYSDVCFGYDIYGFRCVRKNP